jgi:hypothetical protein
MKAFIKFIFKLTWNGIFLTTINIVEHSKNLANKAQTVKRPER